MTGPPKTQQNLPSWTNIIRPKEGDEMKTTWPMDDYKQTYQADLSSAQRNMAKRKSQKISYFLIRLNFMW